MECILCGTSAGHFFHDEKRAWDYFLCPTCDLRFLHPQNRLTSEAETKRYLLHENDVNDVGYQNFVGPLYDLILKKVPSTEVSVLDFGCGPGPVLKHLLTPQGYNVALYDPVFQPNADTLKAQYDLVFSTEVVEHFFNPNEEFQRLHRLLAPNGQLAIMTGIYEPRISFADWSYRYDPTHVCFYSHQTFTWIQKHFGFQSYEKHGERVAWFLL